MILVGGRARTTSLLLAGSRLDVRRRWADSIRLWPMHAGGVSCANAGPVSTLPGGASRSLSIWLFAQRPGMTAARDHGGVLEAFGIGCHTTPGAAPPWW